MNLQMPGYFAFGAVMLLIPAMSWQMRYIYRLEKRIETLEHDIDVAKVVVLNEQGQLQQTHIKRTHE